MVVEFSGMGVGWVEELSYYIYSSLMYQHTFYSEKTELNILFPKTLLIVNIIISILYVKIFSINKERKI